MHVRYFLCFLLFLQGCAVEQYPYNLDTAPSWVPQHPPPSHVNVKQDRPIEPVVKIKRYHYISDDRRYEGTSLRMPSVISAGKKRWTRARYFKLLAKDPEKKKRLIVVLSIPDSKHTFPQETITEYLMKYSLNTDVLLILDSTSPLPWEKLGNVNTEDELSKVMRDSAETMREMITDILRWITWGSKQAGIDPNRVGIVGFSFGAVYAMTVMGLDRRISAGVFMEGGGEIYKILASYSGEGHVFRDVALERLGWNNERFKREIKSVFLSVDPMTYARHIDPRRVLFIEAEHDDVFPRAVRHSTWKALGEPARVVVPFFSHRYSFICMTIVCGWSINNIITDFFLEKL